MWNAGDLPQDWTIDTLMQKHNSEPHNPSIAAPFFLAGYIESWGRGIEKIIEESQKFNGITPQFRWLNGLWVEFYFNNTPNKIEDTETRVKTRVKTREKILEFISANPNITNQELADILELTVKGIEWQIKKLKEDGKLERIGGAKGGHWEILK
jgi:ATP-dependent DNA helicase RecG